MMDNEKDGREITKINIEEISNITKSQIV